MDKIKILIVAAITFMAVSCAKTDEGRYFEPGGNYSICPPASWEAAEFPGLKYKILRGDQDNGIQPNVVFVEENAQLSLNDYADASIDTMKQLFGGDIKIIQKSEFETAKTLQGKRIVYSTTQHGRALRQIYYIFPGQEGAYMNITCTAAAEKNMTRSSTKRLPHSNG